MSVRTRPHRAMAVEREGPTAAGQHRLPAPHPDVQRVLALQRAVGNSAVSEALATPTVQRALTAEFVGPTPDQDQVLQAVESGGALTSPQFEVRARIVRGDDDPSCKPGQYRQYVKGVFLRRGVPQEGHALDSGPLRADEFQEDRQGKRRYGYRGTSEAPTYYYSDPECTTGDLHDGCHFRCYDRPNATEDDDEMRLRFRGVVIDVERRALLASREWSVYGKKGA